MFTKKESPPNNDMKSEKSLKPSVFAKNVNKNDDKFQFDVNAAINSTKNSGKMSSPKDSNKVSSQFNLFN